MKRLASLLLLVVLQNVACAPGVPAGTRANARDTLDALPPWSYDELSHGVLEAFALQSGAEAGTTIRVLAWRRQRNDRSLVVNEALVWVRLTRPHGSVWALVHLFQHPHASGAWLPSFINDADWQPARYFRFPPTNADVYAFIDSRPHTTFFRTDEGFVGLAAGVRRSTWRHAIGEDATRDFDGFLTP